MRFRRRLLALLVNALESFAKWALSDHFCAHCGLVTPRLDLTLVYPLGLLCHACRKEHTAPLDAAPRPPRPPARVKGRVR